VFNDYRTHRDSGSPTFELGCRGERQRVGTSAACDQNRIPGSNPRSFKSRAHGATNIGHGRSQAGTLWQFDNLVLKSFLSTKPILEP
jgi:hypothetical protein